MARVDRFLQSNVVKSFVLIVGLFAGLLRLAGGAFPDQVQIIAMVLFILAVVYLVLATLRTAKLYFENERKWRAELAEKLEERIPEDQSVFEYTARRYGMGYEYMDIECEIKKDGVELRRLLKVQAYSVVPQIDNTLSLQPQEESHCDLAHPRIKSLDPARTLHIEAGIGGPGTVVVTISPPLRESENVEFVLTEEITGKFFETSISRSELQRRSRENDQDFFAWRIDRPTRKLSLKVTFPDGFRPMSYSHHVFFAPVMQGLPSREQHEELRRINGLVLRTSNRGQPQLVLDVDYPAVGLLYAIYWNPPVDESLP